MMRRTFFIAAVFLVGMYSSRAQIPHTVSYQGILTDTTGAAKPDGVYNFTFRFYSVPSGGSALWTEDQPLQVKRGLFSALLGSVTPITDSVKFDQQIWLGVQLESDPEFTPRIQFASVGSSLNSYRAEVAKSVPDSSITGGKIAAGQIIRSINNLHDNLTVRGANGAAVTTNGDTITISATGGGGGGIGTIQNTNNTLDIVNPAGPTTTVNVKIPFTVNGNVGIGTTTPIHRLRIAGGPSWTSNQWLGAMEFENGSAFGWHSNGGGKRFGIGQSNGGLYFFTTAADPGTIGSPANYVMTISDNANVGIGTTTPSSRLEIAGQDGLAITGYQPFLTLRDANAGNARTVVQNADGGLNLFANSYLVGTNPSAFLHLDNSGNIGIGTATPTSGKLQVIASSGSAVYASSGSSAGLYGLTSTGSGVSGVSPASGIGVYGQSNSSFGVYGVSSSGNGAYGFSTSGYGVYGESNTLHGVYGRSNGNGAGIYGSNSNTAGYAAYFVGRANITTDLHVGGNLSSLSLDVSGSKNFKIDHPLDPANKYLRHASVESNEALLIYSGTITTDARGEATVQLPAYFEALNTNFRYQLTVVGGEFAQSRVSKKISNNQFSIKTDRPDVEICWQVTGDRNDAFYRAYPLVVEEEKKPEDRGKYLQPEQFGQPKEKLIGYQPSLQDPGTKAGSPSLPASERNEGN